MLLNCGVGATNEIGNRLATNGWRCAIECVKTGVGGVISYIRINTYIDRYYKDSYTRGAHCTCSVEVHIV